MSPAEPAPPSPLEYARLISLAVHELRTPLSVVNGYLRMLRDDPAVRGSERPRRLIEEAERSCLRLATLIEELSELGKLDAGTAVVVVESFDVFALVHEVASALESTGDDAQLAVTGASSGGQIVGDRTRLRAALACAMRAVRREHGSGSTVVVDVQRTDDKGRPVALVTVALSTDLEHARLAAPGPVDEGRGGLGLSLPIARRVIEGFGGRMWSPLPPDGAPPIPRGAVLLCLPLADSPRHGPRTTI